MQKVIRAIEVVMKAHGMTPRKYAKHGQEVPYSIHVVRVLWKVCDYLETWPSAKRFHDLYDDMCIVAVLHDVPEDTKYPLDEIHREFGDVVMDGLHWLTNPSKKHLELRRAARKQMDFDHLAKAPDHWKVIKMWDRVDNLYDMTLAEKDFILNLYIPESVRLKQVVGDADKEVAETLQSAIEWLRIVTEHDHAVPAREARRSRRQNPGGDGDFLRGAAGS